MLRNICILVAMAVFAGCANGRTYFGDGPNSESRLTIVQAIERLETDPMFTQNYARAKKVAKTDGKTLPSVVVRPFENNANGLGDGVIRQMYKRLQTALRKTGKFEIIDPAVRQRMVHTVISGVDNGEIGSSLQNYGEYHSADFVIFGELVREGTGEYSVNLEMMDVRTGSVFWSEVVTPSDSLYRR